MSRCVSIQFLGLFKEKQRVEKEEQNKHLQERIKIFIEFREKKNKLKNVKKQILITYDKYKKIK